MSLKNCISCDAAHSGRNWFALRVRSRHEKSVALRLSEKSIECFVPLMKVERRWANRLVHTELPLISGYVFINIHRAGILPLLQTPGVVDVVRSTSTATVIPESEICAIQRAISVGLPIEACEYVQSGRRVTIRRGPLAGVVGTVTRRNHDQLVLSVSLLKRSVQVQVDMSKLCECTPAAALLARKEKHLELPQDHVATSAVGGISCLGRT